MACLTAFVKATVEGTVFELYGFGFERSGAVVSGWQFVELRLAFLEVFREFEQGLGEVEHVYAFLTIFLFNWQATSSD